MYIYADKNQENKSQSVANAISQNKKSKKSTFQFTDNRPEAMVQRKLQKIADNNTAVSQLMEKGERGLEAKKDQLEKDIASIDEPSMEEFRKAQEDKIRKFANDEYAIWGAESSYTPYYKDTKISTWKRIGYRMCEDRRMKNEPGHSKVTKDELKDYLDKQDETEKRTRIKNLQEKNTEKRGIIQR